MSKKNRPPADPEENDQEISPMQKRWFWIRTTLLTALVFIFILYYTYPTSGNGAFLWAIGLAAAVLGYFLFSYYKLYR